MLSSFDSNIVCDIIVSLQMLSYTCVSPGYKVKRRSK